MITCALLAMAFVVGLLLGGPRRSYVDEMRRRGIGERDIQVFSERTKRVVSR